MKRILLTLAALGMTLAALAQPQLNENNIEEVLKAMTLQEKATLLVGGARAAIVNGVTSGVAAEVPGAAGNTRPIERLGIPGTILADGPAGLRIQPTRKGTDQTFYCTGFPVGTLLASSWDVDLVKSMTRAMGSGYLLSGRRCRGPGVQGEQHRRLADAGGLHPPQPPLRPQFRVFLRGSAPVR